MKKLDTSPRRPHQRPPDPKGPAKYLASSSSVFSRHKRINVSFLVCFALAFGVPQVAAARVVITEIMYDAPGPDAGHEWIEIFNDGSTEVSLEGWRLLENNTKHKLTPIEGGGTIEPYGYAIIVDNAENFRSDFSGFGGRIFDSAFSLSNTGETISLLDGSGATVSAATYEGNAGDGNSLNASGNDFVARMPSPGAAIARSANQPTPKEAKAAKPTKEKDSDANDVENAAAEFPETEIVQDTPRQIAAPQQQAPARIFSQSSVPWWIATALIALAAGSALFYSRSIKRAEWNIVEEEG